MATESPVPAIHPSSRLIYPLQNGIWRIRNSERSPSDISPESNIYGDHLSERSKGRHWGWDLEAPVGTAVYCIRGGRVTRVSRNDSSSGWGPNHVWHTFVFNGQEYEVGYCHLSSVASFIDREGVSVADGMQLGLSGQTGLGSPPHLHLEFHLNGRHVNPSMFFGAPPIQ